MSATHGTRSRYVAGCRCTPCRKANTVSESDRRRRQLYGAPGAYVPSSAARAHLHALLAAGHSVRAIARAAGVSRQTVIRLQRAEGRRPAEGRVHATTAARLVELSPGGLDVADGAFVNARGAQRRLKALMAIGWTMPALADALGRKPCNLRRVLDAGQVTRRTDREIRDLYDTLWNAPPDRSTPRRGAASDRARDHARRQGWVAPMAWDDIDDDTHPWTAENDDPDDVDDMDVDIAVERTIARLPICLTAAERDAVIERLTRTGWSLEQIADVMGISSRTVSRARATRVA